jgi:hypothetical protein
MRTDRRSTNGPISVAGSSWRGRVGRCASARSTGARLGRLIEITTQPLLEMLADNTPQRHLTATLGAPEEDGKWAHRNAIICR